MRRTTLSALSLILALFLSGCQTEQLRNEQLEKVAKDWSLVIRASQVIPVYPLSEDLQPGDVLLVTLPVEQQVQLYKDKGFLPLDQHMVRFHPDEYPTFYGGRYGIGPDSLPPNDWQQVGPDGKHGWDAAPHAAFPTYQFSVQTGSGMNLAIPISGVPFAMGLMNSGKASGTVTISEAYTYGLDILTVEARVREWAEKNRKLLRSYGPVEGNYQYLRVVTRVYVTGAVDVSVLNDEATGAEAGAGADRPVEIIAAEEGATGSNFAAAVGSINDLLKEQMPGGKVKVAMASSRSVSLTETFDRPLVIGYVGFDLPILGGGRLGRPISTLEQLNGRVSGSPSSYTNPYRLAAVKHVYRALQDEPEGTERDELLKRLDSMGKILPETYAFVPYESAGPGAITPVGDVDPIDPSSFEGVLDYLGYASKTVRVLESYLPTAPRETPEQRAVVTALEANLVAARTAVEEVGEQLQNRGEVIRAIDFVFLGE